MSKSMLRTKKLATIAILSALSFGVTYLSKLIPINIAGFLNMDFKDVVIVIGGLIFGPVSAAAIATIASLIEFFTISDTGVIGLFMNVLSSCAFACLAAAVYKKRRTMKAAVIGLALGVLAATAAMLLWNYIITPFYLADTPENVANLRKLVTGMLIPVFLPFNLLKYGLNMALSVLLYKPVITALRKARLVPEPENRLPGRKISWPLMFVAFFLMVTCVVLILVLAGVI